MLQTAKHSFSFGKRLFFNSAISQLFTPFQNFKPVQTNIQPFVTQFTGKRYFSKTPKETEKKEEQYDEKKAKEFENKCQNGDVNAMYEYGRALLEGTDGIKKDFEKSARYFKQGADLNDPKCMNSYGLCLLYGDGVKQDSKAAFSYFRKAADCGNSEAQYYVGFCYQMGQGVEKNEKEFIKYLKMSADNGYSEACSIYGTMLLRQEDQKTDSTSLAYQYFKKAADLGDINGQYIYGMALLTGAPGVSMNKGQAAVYLKKAAEQSHSDAQCIYGHLLYHGDGVPKDLKEATRFFGLSAVQGNPEG